jgi:uncharacterized protein YigA (DUF484 family)
MITTNDVLSWLADHPDLLIDHPELLDQLKLPHDAGATSLIERQVERLRDNNRKLERRLATLTSIASENEQLIRRLHTLSLALMAQPSVEACLSELFRRLSEEFQSDALVLHLARPLGGSPLPEQVIVQQEWSEALERMREQGDIECGRLTRSKLEALFGEDSAAGLASAAIVPLDGVGLLAIGSASEDRFHPGMGTLFLELLAETLITRLRADMSSTRKRA